jgi:hypothetical protein
MMTRSVLCVVIGLCVGVATVAAASESRTFVVANAADGYGVDQCLATGANCGKLIANSYCQTHDFAEARSFRKIDSPEITGSIPALKPAGWQPDRDGYVAIECIR